MARFQVAISACRNRIRLPALVLTVRLSMNRTSACSTLTPSASSDSAESCGAMVSIEDRTCSRTRAKSTLVTVRTPVLRRAPPGARREPTR